MQSYFREATRTCDVKVFKCEIVRVGVEQNEVIYFTNRIEIGAHQQTQSLNILHDYLNESHESVEAKLNLRGIRDHGIKKPVQDKHAFDVTVELTEVDQLGKTADLT